jgi:solute carrier family 45 protein 1/2/4
MQPIVGIMADKSTSRWGRRRPVMVGGTVIVSICLLILGWTKEIVAAFVEEGELVGQSQTPDCNMRNVS